MFVMKYIQLLYFNAKKTNNTLEPTYVMLRPFWDSDSLVVLRKMLVVHVYMRASYVLKVPTSWILQ